MKAETMIKAFKEEYPELAERVQFVVIHDSISIACSPEDELEVMEVVNELNTRHNKLLPKQIKGRPTS